MKRLLQKAPFGLLLFLLGFGALVSTTFAQGTQAEAEDPLVGEWLWFNNIVINIEPGGRVSGDARGTWAFTNNKEVERKYVVKWDRSVVVDNLVLSRDGKKLSGKNNSGHAVSATRIAQKAPPASAKSLAALLAREQRSVKGSFYVSVDDSASIYLNGTKVHQAGLNESRSDEMEIKTGDRIVVKLNNALAGHRFMMAFVSTDEAQVINFRTKDFRIPPDTRIRNFTIEEFASWTKPARQEQHRNTLPVKSSSNWVWADRDDGIIACLVMPEMITSKTR